jgi:arsenate reductase
VERIHIGFDDPSQATGTPEEILPEFRRVRDEIRYRLEEFFATNGGKYNGQGGKC